VLDSFTLADLEQRTGVSVDRLRYILDARILPGTRRGPQVLWQKSPGRGVARTFTPYEAFGIVVAILMLDAGVKRDTLKRCLDLVCQPAPGTGRFQTSMLWRAFVEPGIGSLELGDGLNVRLAHSAAATDRGLGSGRSPQPADPWWQLQTRQPLADGYDPLVTIRINVAGLRNRLREQPLPGGRRGGRTGGGPAWTRRHRPDPSAG
jgi:hypothetical protein